MDVTLVAIPSKPQRVWGVSSEKVPHLTILYLGSKVENLKHIEEFIEHATKTLRPFFLEVDRRGLLGDHDADVLFFSPKWAKKIETFRSQLLTDTDIFKAYHSVEQYPSWTPHLTLGYPESPAKPDPNEHGQLNYVEFDSIALWTGDYEGRVFPLETDSIEDVGHTALRGQEYIEHFGVLGMKWGVRREEKRAAKAEKKWASKALSPRRYLDVTNIAADQMNAVHIPRMNAKPQYRNADFTKPSALRDKYHQEYTRLLERELNRASSVIGGDIDPTNKKRLRYKIGANGAVFYRLEDIRHAEEDDALFTATTDDMGHIVKFSSAVLQQSDTDDEVLEHYGVKGMKWGVIRDRVTSATEAAGKTVPGKVYKTAYVPSRDALSATKYQARAKLGGVKNLSNEELRSVINRLALEAKYKELYGEKQWHTRGKRWAGKFLTDVLKGAAASWLNNPFSRAGSSSSNDRSPISVQAWSNGQQIAGAIESGL